MATLPKGESSGSLPQGPGGNQPTSQAPNPECAREQFPTKGKHSFAAEEGYLLQQKIGNMIPQDNV